MFECCVIDFGGCCFDEMVDVLGDGDVGIVEVVFIVLCGIENLVNVFVLGGFFV